MEEKNRHINLGSNEYPSPIFMIINTIIGLLLLYALSDWIRRILKVDKGIAYIGKHTMFILFLHFIAFKIINLIQVWVYKKEGYELATFPYLETEQGWWIAYAVVGIIIPLVINWLRERIKLLVFRIDKKNSYETNKQIALKDSYEDLIKVDELQFLQKYRCIDEGKKETIIKIVNYFVE